MFTPSKYFGQLYSYQQTDVQAFVANTAAALTLWDNRYPTQFHRRGTQRDPTTNDNIVVLHSGVYRLTLNVEIEVDIGCRVKAYFYDAKTSVAAQVAYGETETKFIFPNEPGRLSLDIVAPLERGSDIRVYLVCTLGTNVMLCNGNFIIQGICSPLA